MKPSEIITVIEKTAPPERALSWDVCGVQVAAFCEKVTHLAVLLDPTLPAIRAALAGGANFILSHHPLSMKPRFPNKADDYLTTLSLLLAHSCWLYSAHTSLDGNPHGPVRWLAKALALENIQVLEATDACGNGLGFIGDLPAYASFSAFCTSLAKVLGKGSWQVCGPVQERVRRIACCPGSGSSLAHLAAEMGADVFITGDVKYHAALESPLCMLDVGHFCLEEEMMRQFAHELQQHLSIPVTFFPGFDPLQPLIPVGMV